MPVEAVPRGTAGTDGSIGGAGSDLPLAVAKNSARIAIRLTVRLIQVAQAPPGRGDRRASER